MNKGLMVLIALGVAAQAAECAEPALSAAETAIIAQQIAAMKGAADRHVAEGWTNAKKVAEFICRPAALPALKKQDKSVDRIFLGTNDTAGLTLASNQSLTGSGTFRGAAGWTDFKFSCAIDAATGKVISFQTK